MLPPVGTDNLPIRAQLSELLAVVRETGTAVLVSPPGTGKTTLVPLALADELNGQILVAQPRRVAARAAAARMSALVGDELGRSVGYSVRGDSKRSRHTRVEVVTTGLLVRRLQHDPELAGVAAVILDECHERQTETDLALAFCVDVRANLRPDLRLVAMSATTHAAGIAEALGGLETPGTPAPIVTATGAIHPVETVWCAPSSAIVPPQGTRVDPALLRHVAAVVRRAAGETIGDILVFLPGGYEIAEVTRHLAGLGLEIQTLHGSMTAAGQDRVLNPSANRRVVLSSAIAESSLTVPGVRVVVDAGLSRVPRTDLARGLSALVTIRESKASATQRAGRAGREGPGWVYRCWSEADHEWLPAYPEPEVAVTDLTHFALELAAWGNPGGVGLSLLDRPPAPAMEIADKTLRSLGAVDESGRITQQGRELSAVGVHPRFARALIDATPRIGSDWATELVAMLTVDTAAPRTDDLLQHWRSLQAGTDRPATARWREEISRLRRPHVAPANRSAEQAAGLVVGLAYPERISRLRPQRDDAKEANRTYLMAGGTAAELSAGTALLGSGWLAIATADRPPGHRHARIRGAVAIDQETALAAGIALHSTSEVVQWKSGDVRSAEVETLGAITLVKRPLISPDPEQVRAALRDGLRQGGLGLFRWSQAATDLRQRLAACHAGLGAPWPAVDDAAVLAEMDLTSVRNRAGLQRIDLVATLRSMLGWQQAAELNSVAPERIQVPSGSSIRVDYQDPTAPTLPVKLQEVFGWGSAPTVAGTALRLSLLTPAGRVAAITSDLSSFWVTGYPAVRAELRGRYPRHPWPADPAEAIATRRVNPRK